jgi:DNA-binding MarR family transcriptional regulator
MQIEPLTMNDAEIEVYYKELQDLMTVYTAHLNHLRHKFFKEFKISSQQYEFLNVVELNHPNPVNMMKVRELMPDKMSDVTRISERLLNEGFIFKKHLEFDKRNVVISITEKGQQLLKEIRLKNDVLTNHLKSLNSDEIELFNKIMKKINL